MALPGSCLAMFCIPYLRPLYMYCNFVMNCESPREIKLQPSLLIISTVSSWYEDMESLLFSPVCHVQTETIRTRRNEYHGKSLWALKWERQKEGVWRKRVCLRISTSACTVAVTPENLENLITKLYFELNLLGNNPSLHVVYPTRIKYRG